MLTSSIILVLKLNSVARNFVYPHHWAGFTSVGSLKMLFRLFGSTAREIICFISEYNFHGCKNWATLELNWFVKLYETSFLQWPGGQCMHAHLTVSILLYSIVLTKGILFE